MCINNFLSIIGEIKIKIVCNTEKLNEYIKFASGHLPLPIQNDYNNNTGNNLNFFDLYINEKQLHFY